ncbi:hypothetical protein JXA47_12615 [Candidatus Sumerlaeota bacterium]|nr:hypothetical protein [Candidatus Sumerlaeota bacterium]
MAGAEPIWNFDLTDAKRCRRTQPASRCGFSVGHGFPILIGSDVAGVLEFFGPGRITPDERLVRVMRTVCWLLAGVIERKRSEQRVHRLRDSLTHFRDLASLGQAVAGMAHRIKNIVSGLRGSANLVTRALEETRLDTVERIWPMFLRNTGLLASLLDDMLHFSKRTDLTLARDNLNRVAEEAVELFRSQALRRGVGLTLCAQPTVPDTVFDRSCLFDTLENLIRNAIDACDKNGGGGIRVTTGCDAERGEVWFEVADDGLGIPEEIRPRIFEPFFTTKGKQGTGLGLSLCLKNINAMGGHIAVASQPGCTVFRVTLPMIPPCPECHGTGNSHEEHWGPSGPIREDP